MLSLRAIKSFCQLEPTKASWLTDGPVPAALSMELSMRREPLMEKKLLSQQSPMLMVDRSVSVNMA